MDVIMQVADKLGIGVVEDNAHALYARYRGRHLGTFGQLATQSFHETKNFSCGEGGALLINDPRLIARAEILREKGTDRSRFFRGQVDKYTWVDVGSSYLPSDLLAAILLAQLEQREAIQRQRHHIWTRYHAGLADWAAAQSIQLPFVPEHCEQSYHMFYMLLPDLDTRTRFINHMKDRRILSVFHYYPLHLSAEGTRLGGRRGQCPVAEDASDRLVRLPFFRDLSEADLDYTIEAVLEFRS
jgi:dTDP-4-amino-4,6-dideoxygalactose transaminase